jgi:hypothetical protein
MQLLKLYLGVGRMYTRAFAVCVRLLVHEPTVNSEANAAVSYCVRG